MPVIAGGNDYGLRADGLRHEGINGKGVFRKYHLVVGGHHGAGNQLQHVVGAVAQRYLFRPDAVVFRQRRLQPETVAIRVTGNVRGSTEDRPRLCAGTQGVFVRGQLDDVLQSQLAFQFLDRLARLVGLDPRHSRRGQGNQIARHKYAGNR